MFGVVRRSQKNSRLDVGVDPNHHPDLGFFIYLYFQGCHTCSSVAVQKFCVILSWWLSSWHRRSWATTTLHREPDIRRYPEPQHLWWQSFCSCLSRAMEQFTATSQRCWLTVQSVPTVTKDIFCLDSACSHGAVRTILTAPSRNNLTYLLTYLLTYYCDSYRQPIIKHDIPRRRYTPYRVLSNSNSSFVNMMLKWLACVCKREVLLLVAEDCLKTSTTFARGRCEWPASQCLEWVGRRAAAAAAVCACTCRSFRRWICASRTWDAALSRWLRDHRAVALKRSRSMPTRLDSSLLTSRQTKSVSEELWSPVYQ